MYLGERTAPLSNRGANCVDDVCLGHGKLLVLSDVVGRCRKPVLSSTAVDIVELRGLVGHCRVAPVCRARLTVSGGQQGKKALLHLSLGRFGHTLYHRV